jgi:predicted nucleic acid-binding protein
LSPPRIALDTNVLVYAEGLLRARDDRPKIDASRLIMRGLLRGGARPVTPAQALAELHRVLTRKGGLDRGEAEARVRRIGEASEIAATTPSALDAALRLATDHRLQIFDALIVAAAVEARADLLLSEDLSDGFSWRGLVVRNPFEPPSDPAVARVIATGS